MDVTLVDLLRTVDPADLGKRIRNARRSRGWTQSELAAGDITVSYVSRIESGARRPNLTVLTAMAERLDTSADHLLRGVVTSEYDEIRLGLDYAELALEAGEAVDAERQAREHLARAESASLAELVERGRLLLGRALESTGELDEAIAIYESLVGSTAGLLQIECGIALSRCYRESDDLALAIDSGERVQAAIADSGLEHTDEAVRLAVTTALAYAHRGDLAHATRLAAQAIERAEQLGSPSARAAAYWNASVFRAQQGDVATALPLAARALSLLGEGQDARNLARLRLQLGDWQVQQDPPLIDEGLANLRRGREEMVASSATRVELAEADIQLAKALVLAGQPDRAAELAASAQAAAPDRGAVTFAEATVARAQALAALGRATDAHQACRDAMAALDYVGSDDRATAQAWFEIADVLKALGDSDTAWDALRNAASTRGLRPVGSPRSASARADARALT